MCAGNMLVSVDKTRVDVTVFTIDHVQRLFLFHLKSSIDQIELMKRTLIADVWAVNHY